MSDFPAEHPLAVLIAEDSRLDAELLHVQLRKAYPAARAEFVRDEGAFMEALARGGWDVVLSDYELQGFTGADLLEHRNRHAPELPFLFVSGVIGEDNAVELLKRGATDYVSKARLERLAPALARALGESEERRARREAERQLRQADLTFVQVADALREVAVILLDEAGRIQFWNRGAATMFGWTTEEVHGRSGALLFPPDDDPERAFAAELAAASRDGATADNRWLRARDGRRVWAEGALTALADDAGAPRGFCKLVRDATAAHLAAQALRAAKEEADRANQAKDRFLAVLSHELRTPLTPILTAVHVLERSAQVPERYGDLLPMIRRNVALESRLIDDLLDLTAISAGKVHLQRARVDMHQLAEAVVAMVAETAREKDVRLLLRLAAPETCVEADQARMQQVLWNVVRNAIKFTPAGGTVELSSRTVDGQLELACRDSGIGIDPEALPRIFRPFEQADAEVSRSFGGLGLGLAIAHGLMQQHGGQIEAASEGRGHGARFTLRMPLAAPLEDAAPQPVAQATPDGGRRRILLVEDNEDAAIALAMCLEEYGYVVHHAATCADALRAADAAAFDAVLTDLGLPDGSGLDIGRALSPRLPVLALSGYGGEQDLLRTTEAGFSGHLIKPVDPAEVHARLSQVLTHDRVVGSARPGGSRRTATQVGN